MREYNYNDKCRNSENKQSELAEDFKKVIQTGDNNGTKTIRGSKAAQK